ncbi:MAG TPA: HAD-IA family hydrolase, partial [Rhodocyclaceae bacterium]|nr:HAD-IA family hydrolase [Rhodocyclaceae bacterium]
LFDLDGTLADTALDLAAALNQLRIEEGLPALSVAALRPYISQGVRGLLQAGMSMSTDHPQQEEFAERVLVHYANNICVHTTLFPGISALLNTLEQRGIAWGIVTNKRSRFTTPLVAALGLTQRAASVVSGDTAARPKPAPDPLLHACEETGIAPAACLYAGDDRRDIIAGRTAGMRTLATAWGYLGVDDPIENWGADHIINEPAEVLAYLS